jgi:hypothetical protein
MKNMNVDYIPCIHVFQYRFECIPIFAQNILPKYFSKMKGIVHYCYPSLKAKFLFKSMTGITQISARFVSIENKSSVIMGDLHVPVRCMVSDGCQEKSIK